MKYLNFIWLFLRFKFYLIIAGLRLGVPFYMLLINDLSKLSPAQFGPYARKLYKQNDYDNYFTQIEINEEYKEAQRIHYTTEKHHWDYYVSEPGEATEMPENCVREMLAGFFAASRTYNGHWDISGWLSENVAKMTFHPNTRKRLYELLQESGYEIHSESDKVNVVKES